MMTETQFIKSVTPSWDDYFMEMLPLVARRSKDPNTKVGAIIVGHDNAIRTTGYNGLCSFIDDSRPERWSREGGEKYFWCEHAERNAIYSAARNGVALKGGTIYVSFLPCVDCARAIVQVGLKRVVANLDEQERRCAENDQWQKSFARTLTHFKEAEIELVWWRKTEESEVAA